MHNGDDCMTNRLEGLAPGSIPQDRLEFKDPDSVSHDSRPCSASLPPQSPNSRLFDSKNAAAAVEQPETHRSSDTSYSWVLRLPLDIQAALNSQSTQIAPASGLRVSSDPAVDVEQVPQATCSPAKRTPVDEPEYLVWKRTGCRAATNGPFPTLATAKLLLDHSREDARARLIRETREQILAETVRAEPMVVTVRRDDPVIQSKRPRLVWWVGIVLCLCVVGAVIGARIQKSSHSNAANVPPTLHVTPPTRAPLLVLEDGRIAFTSTQQLYDAVDAFYKELDENKRVSNTSDVSIRHGYPIGTWDVSRLSDFSRVFDPARKQGLDPDRNPRAKTTFDEDLSGWDTSMATTMAGMFAAAMEFTGQGLDAWNVQRVTDFSHMFALAEHFNCNLSAWNTSSAVFMNGVFLRAISFTHDVSRFDMSSVTTVAGMFRGARRFTGGDLTQWNVSSATNMNALFSGAVAFDGNVSSWDTSRVEDMEAVFYSAETFNGDLSAWDVGNVETMDAMFMEAINFVGGNLTGWNTSRVKNMDYLFNRASKFAGDVSTWDVSRVTYFMRTFQETNFNGDISAWDTSGVEYAEEMFQANRAFSGDLSAWNTSKLKHASFMFWDANAFNGDVSQWDVSKLIDASSMFLEADMFNQSLCEWQDRLPATAKVANMFKDTACVDNSDPLMGADAASWAGSFCTVCRVA